MITLWLMKTKNNLTLIKGVDEETYSEADNLGFFRMQIKEDWKRQESEEICIYGKVVMIVLIHYVFMSRFHEDQ